MNKREKIEHAFWLSIIIGCVFILSLILRIVILDSRHKIKSDPQPDEFYQKISERT